MHIKTNIEASSVQFVVLAICPLLTVINGLSAALFYVVGTLVCLIFSQMLCVMLNKFLGRKTKIFLTALISVCTAVAAQVFIEEYTTYVFEYEAFYVVFSTVILSSEFIYFKNPAVIKHYLLYVLRSFVVFAVITVLFSTIKEFLSFGTIYGNAIIKSFAGIEFFASFAFSLLLLAILCFVFDVIIRRIDKVISKKEVIYQKYLKKIRDERIFQYDQLRRSKILTNEIEVNKIGWEEAEALKKKISENEEIISVSEAIKESKEEQENFEESALEEESLEENANDEEEIDDNGSKKKKKEKKKKRKKQKDEGG